MDYSTLKETMKMQKYINRKYDPSNKNELEYEYIF